MGNYIFSIMASTKYNKFLSGNQIREIFLDYFGSNGHHFIRPSSVKPIADPSLEFVNAGMNQFKNVFLGLEKTPFNRGTNSQKCIRVGGKHNDLNAVGIDGYHHTFFEMLGNWSFNDYFKEEACQLAWKLVTDKPFVLHPKRLYVTYFGGDEKNNLEPDLETKEIWRKLGVDKERILPFGLNDNFWEMGPYGPCGPCTEIHYDHLGTVPRPGMVNRGSPDLTELWNLVFIQYNRLADNSLQKLKKHFVDTGMGFERLVALLQEKHSNYDSDLFSPYFSAISKFTGLREYRGQFGDLDEDGLDTAYRILADHSRMITIAIGDSVLPDESYSLRRVIRKALVISERLAPGKGVSLLSELCSLAAQSFANIFPETINKEHQMRYILQDENDVWEETKARVKFDWEELIKRKPEFDTLSEVRSRGLISSLEELEASDLEPGSTIPPDVCITMYDRYGLTTQLIAQLAEVTGYNVDLKRLEKDIYHLKEKNKALIYSANTYDFLENATEFIVNNLNKTDDSPKVDYWKTEKNTYHFESLKCFVKAVVLKGKVLDNSELLEPGSSVALLLDRSNMWPTMGPNKQGDVGQLILVNEGKSLASISIDKAVNIGGYIYHFGTLSSNSSVSVKELRESQGRLSVERETRLSLMRNTTAAHLLMIAAREMLSAVLRAVSITPKRLALTFSLFGHNFVDKDVKTVEEKVRELCQQHIDIELSTLSTTDLVSLSGLDIPPFVVPSAVTKLNIATFNTEKRIRDIAFGPNLLNTYDAEDVCIVGVEKKNRNRDITITAVAGNSVNEAKKSGGLLLNMVDSLDSNSEEGATKVKDFMKHNFVPWSVQEEVNSKLLAYKSSLKANQLLYRMESLKNIISRAEGNNDKFIVAFCGHEVKLEKLTRIGGKLPMLLLAVNKNYLNARCYVPLGSDFSAKEWMDEVAQKFGTSAVPSKRHAPEVFYMTPLRINSREQQLIVEQFEATAKSIVKRLLENKERTEQEEKVEKRS